MGFPEQNWQVQKAYEETASIRDGISEKAKIAIEKRDKEEFNRCCDEWKSHFDELNIIGWMPYPIYPISMIGLTYGEIFK